MHRSLLSLLIATPLLLCGVEVALADPPAQIQSFTIPRGNVSSIRESSFEAAGSPVRAVG